MTFTTDHRVVGSVAGSAPGEHPHYDPSFTLKSGQRVILAGYKDSLYTVSYYLPIHSKPIKAVIKGNKARSQNLQVYGPSFTHGGMGGGGVKLDQLSELPVYGLLFPSNKFKSSKSSDKGDKRQKHKICDFITLV